MIDRDWTEQPKTGTSRTSNFRKLFRVKINRTESVNMHLHGMPRRSPTCSSASAVLWSIQAESILVIAIKWNFIQRFSLWCDTIPLAIADDAETILTHCFLKFTLTEPSACSRTKPALFRAKTEPETGPVRSPLTRVKWYLPADRNDIITLIVVTRT